MNPILYGLKRIKQEIPQQLLALAYREPTIDQFAIPVSVDSIIKDRVLIDRVLLDCNLVGGAEVVIDLGSATHERVEPGVHVYRVPKQLTQNRIILSALSIAFSSEVATNVGNFIAPQDEVLNVAKQQLSSIMSVPMISDARVSVIGDNVIMAEHADVYLGRAFLRCIIENDSNMNHLNPRSWDNFSTLCVLAVKADIYINNIVKLDRGYMVGGSEIGEYKNIIESYSDSNEIYREFLKNVWQKTAVMNDPEMRDRLIRITSGRG